MAVYNLTINGKKQQVDVDPDTPMLWVLRDHINSVSYTQSPSPRD